MSDPVCIVTYDTLNDGFSITGPFDEFSDVRLAALRVVAQVHATDREIDPSSRITEEESGKRWSIVGSDTQYHIVMVIAMTPPV